MAFIQILKDNYTWIFSGVGLVIIGGIARLFFRKKEPSIRITQKSGKNSRQYLSQGDMHIHEDRKEND